MSDDNSDLFKQPRICPHCGEKFTLGEMYPGKRYTDPMQCPYCRTGISPFTESAPSEIVEGSQS